MAARLAAAALVAVFTAWPAGARAKSPKEAPSAEDVEFAVTELLGYSGYSRPAVTDSRQIDLGRRLFTDGGLSQDGKMSCSTCHDPSKYFHDGRRRAVGRRGVPLARNTPSLMNAGYYSRLFWDGRAGTIEDAALAAIENPEEMNNKIDAAVASLRSEPKYQAAFRDAFGPAGVSSGTVGAALAAYVLSVRPAENSPFDEFVEHRGSLEPKALRGLVLYMGKAGCYHCHAGRNLGYDNDFVNIGLKAATPADLGRYLLDRRQDHWGAFRVPVLRNIARTAPYMHDGSLATLRDVIDFYDRGGDTGRYQDGDIKPRGLTAQEKDDLEAFLMSLSSK
jgi:cytochrome c peroxidase